MYPYIGVLIVDFVLPRKNKNYNSLVCFNYMKFSSIYKFKKE